MTLVLITLGFFYGIFERLKMIAFPEMLLKAAELANIKTPYSSDKEYEENYSPQEYPHWHVFLLMQLGAPMSNSSVHWTNAEVIAKIPDNKIKTITYSEILGMGFQIGYSK